MGKTLTQREFAELTGASTATVSAMLKMGTLSKAPDGRIPAEEVEHYLEMEIKKYAGNGIYLLSAMDSEEGVLRIKEGFEKSMGGDTLFYAPSIAHILDAVSPCRSGTTDGARDELMKENYNKAVLDAFMKKYLEKAESYFSALYFGKDCQGLCHIPAGIVKELVLYGRVVSGSYSEEEKRECLKELGGFVQVINGYMDNAFEMIVNELELTGGKTGCSLFRRSQLTPEFFLKQGILYNAFFYKYREDGKRERFIMPLKRNAKISGSVNRKAYGSSVKVNIRRLLEDGFYTIGNLYPDAGEGEIQGASVAVGSGFYSRLVVCMTEEEFEEVIPELLKTAIFWAEQNHIIKVQYSGSDRRW